MLAVPLLYFHFLLRLQFLGGRFQFNGGRRFRRSRFVILYGNGLSLCIARIPNKAQLGERLDALCSNVARLAALEFLVLTALMMDPRSQLGIAAIICRYRATAVLGAEPREFPQSFLPGGFVGIPTKFKLVELLGTVLGHVRCFPLLHERVVASLFFDPKT